MSDTKTAAAVPAPAYTYPEFRALVASLAAGHHTTGTGLVFNHHRLAHVVRHLAGNDTCGQVGNAARAERHDDLDGAAGQRLCVCRRRNNDGSGSSEQGAKSKKSRGAEQATV